MSKLLFAGGHGTELHHFDEFMPLIKEQTGFDVLPVILDHKKTIFDWCQFFAKKVDSIPNDENIILGGFSFGASAAVGALAAYLGTTENARRPLGLGICSLSSATQEDFDRYPTLEQEFRDDKYLKLSDHQVEAFKRFSIGVAARKIAQIAIPSFVLLGEYEKECPDMANRSKDFAETIGTKVTTIEGVGHDFMNAKYLRVFIESLRKVNTNQ